MNRYLDNSLRGGVPTILGDVESGKTYDEDKGVKVFHSFSRIHGDLERYVCDKRYILWQDLISFQ